MKLRSKLQYYPINQQKTTLAQLFACVRFIWNNTFAHCKISEKQIIENPKYSLSSINN